MKYLSSFILGIISTNVRGSKHQIISVISCSTFPYLNPDVSYIFDPVCLTLKFTPHFFGTILKQSKGKSPWKSQPIRPWIPFGPCTILVYEAVFVPQQGLSVIRVTHVIRGVSWIVCFWTKAMDSRAAVKLRQVLQFANGFSGLK